MDKQEALDKNWEWFVVQGKPQSVEGWGEDSACVYRGENGCKCAVGVLIPDDRYRRAMERSDADQDWVDRFGMSDLFPKDTVPFLRSLQSRHDSWGPHRDISFTEHMRKELTELAKEHDLTIPSTALAA